MNITPEIINKDNVLLDAQFDITEHVQSPAILKINDKNIPINMSKLVTLFDKTTKRIVPEGHTLLIIGNKIFKSTKEVESKPLINLPLLKEIKIKKRHQVTEEYIQIFLIKPTIVLKDSNMHQPVFHDPIDPNDPLIRKLEKKFNELDKTKNPNRY